MGSKDVFMSLLEQAERRFGTRSRKLRIKVNGREEDIPETLADGPDACVVYYYRKVKHNTQRLRFQLAHEAIHVLSGVFRRDALKFEEGLATWFSLDIFRKDPSYYDKAQASIPPLFKDALELFEQLKPTDETITTLRARCSCLDKVSPDLLKEVFDASDKLANKLCERFPLDMHLRRSP